MSLQEDYSRLLEKHNIKLVEDCENVSTVMRDAINDFMNAHKRVAIYCYGVHTRALMAEYIYELRNIVCIIDNGDVDAKNKGFLVIKDEEIESMKLDGVIISSYLYKEEIKLGLQKNHKGVDFLDFYDVMRDQGIIMDCEFFLFRTPQIKYAEINQIYQNIEQKKNVDGELFKLAKKFLEIKDFRMAAETVRELYGISGNPEHQALAEDIEELYEKSLNVLKQAEDAVLLLCVDGLKAGEFCEEGRLKKTFSAVKERATIYHRAYSYSTSTYESLVPVFTENYDQRSEGYMKTATVPSADCRFVKFAQDQGRNIYVYGGGIKYIEDPQIKYIEHPQTITQMIWSFMNDVESDPRSLFYMQPVNESHFTFPSPYYKGSDMTVDGTNLFYNYLSTKGSNLNRKYSRQYDAAIRYIDDTLAPVLGVIACSTLLFADHGDYDYEEIENKNLEDIDSNHITASEELIRIPMAIIADKEGGEDHSVISLAELNNIAISMMKDEKFKYKEKPYVKIGRTAIYNVDCKYLFNHIFRKEHRLCAFEGFIFEDGYKLLVFSDGTKELYTTKEECLIKNDKLTEDYYRMIETEISVC